MPVPAQRCYDLTRKLAGNLGSAANSVTRRQEQQRHWVCSGAATAKTSSLLSPCSGACRGLPLPHLRSAHRSCVPAELVCPPKDCSEANNQTACHALQQSQFPAPAKPKVSSSLSPGAGLATLQWSHSGQWGFTLSTSVPRRMPPSIKMGTLRPTASLQQSSTLPCSAC